MTPLNKMLLKTFVFVFFTKLFKHFFNTNVFTINFFEVIETSMFIAGNICEHFN